MQGQNQTVNLKSNLLRVGFGIELPQALCNFYRTSQGRLPCSDRAGQGITDWARPVIKLHRTTDVNTARVDFG